MKYYQTNRKHRAARHSLSLSETRDGNFIDNRLQAITLTEPAEMPLSREPSRWYGAACKPVDGLHSRAIKKP
jgi:hypothetical protein